MNAVDPLAELKDIHLPNPISWWPLAPGWYLLCFLLLMIAACLGWFFYRRYQQRQAKREALILLESIEHQYKADPDSQRSSAQIAELLKRVALMYYPRSEVASLHGENWIAFLTRTGKKLDFKSVAFMLETLPFKPHEAIDIMPLVKLAKAWIKQRGNAHV